MEKTKTRNDNSTKNTLMKNTSAPHSGSCDACRTTQRDAETKRKLANRLSKIEGQVRGLKNMLENDAYCNDILIQSAAVNAAINSFNKELLAEHMRSCVIRDIREGNVEIIDELVQTMQKLMK